MKDADVIVVGAGNAAFCAALIARESGASVLMPECAPEAVNGGNKGVQGGVQGEVCKETHTQ
jgi:tricarballylate dehydrogenase